MSTQSKFSFPHLELTKIHGKRDFVSLKVIQRELFANTKSVASNCGNGQLRHAVFIIGDVEHNHLANPGGGDTNDWDGLIHPGNAPVYLANTSAPQVACINAEFDQAASEFMTFG